MDLPAFGRRRATQRFARLVDDRRRARLLPPDRDDAADLAVVEQLERLRPDVTPDPDFKASLRLMLVAAAEREGMGAAAVGDTATVPPPPGRWSPRRRAVVLFGLAATTVALPAAALLGSGGSVPGEPLYDVKRSAEQAELGLSSSQADRGLLLLGFARSRADEADAIAGDKPPEMATILDQMDSETREGVALLAQAAVDRRDPALLDRIAAFETRQRGRMAEVLTDITGGTRTRAAASVQLLDDIKARVDALRASIRCGTAAAAPDALGPQPLPCRKAPPPVVASPTPPVASTSSGALVTGQSQPAPPLQPLQPLPPVPTVRVTPPAPAVAPVPSNPAPTGAPAQADPSPAQADSALIPAAPDDPVAGVAPAPAAGVGKGDPLLGPRDDSQ